jgi:hypothetical protein
LVTPILPLLLAAVAEVMPTTTFDSATVGSVVCES